MASALLNKAKAMFGREAAEPPAAVPRKPVNLYHAVTIAPGPRACTAARELRGRRFLSREAPVLPLKNCGSAECECRYEHYEDRRKGGRRARDLGVSIDGYDGDEKRLKSSRGRRKGD
jgi:hypothetical protein